NKEHICCFEVCRRPFLRKTDLERHVRSVHYQDRPFPCHSCERWFKRRDTLQR
ncbi:hypothetical protein BS50DRAFT_472814, partial [Corynespora cassiicola Philippines]